MPPSKFLETAQRIIRENPEVFDALLEYEHTKRLPKTVYRRRINLTLDENLMRRFRRHCKEHNLTMSRVVEKHIKEELNLR